MTPRRGVRATLVWRRWTLRGDGKSPPPRRAAGRALSRGCAERRRASSGDLSFHMTTASRAVRGSFQTKGPVQRKEAPQRSRGCPKLTRRCQEVASRSGNGAPLRRTALVCDERPTAVTPPSRSRRPSGSGVCFGPPDLPRTTPRGGALTPSSVFPGSLARTIPADWRAAIRLQPIIDWDPRPQHHEKRFHEEVRMRNDL